MTTATASRGRLTSIIIPALVAAGAIVLAGCSGDDPEISAGASITTSSTGRAVPTDREGTDGEMEPGIDVSTDEHQAWILDPDAAGYGVEHGEGVWLTAADVDAAEDILEAALPDRQATASDWEAEAIGRVVDDFDTYHRQYAGAVDGDDVTVYVNAVCTDDVGALDETLVMVADGGSCFWNATVDLSAGEVTSLMVNGEG